MLQGWKEDSMLVKRIAAYTHLSLTVNAPVGSVSIKIPGKVLIGPQKTRIMALPGSEDSLTIG